MVHQWKLKIYYFSSTEALFNYKTHPQKAKDSTTLHLVILCSKNLELMQQSITLRQEKRYLTVILTNQHGCQPSCFEKS